MSLTIPLLVVILLVGAGMTTAWYYKKRPIQLMLGFYSGTAEISVTPVSAQQPVHPDQ